MRTVPSSSNRGIIFFGSTTDIHIPGQHSTCACPERTSASESGKAPFASKWTQRRCGTEQVRCLLKAWAEASLVNDSTGWNRGERMRRNNVFRGVEDPSIVRQVRRLCLPGFPVPFFFFMRFIFILSNRLNLASNSWLPIRSSHKNFWDCVILLISFTELLPENIIRKFESDHTSVKNVSFRAGGCKRLRSEWMSNEVLLHRAGNDIQFLRIERDGREDEKKNVCVHMHD